MGHNLKTSTITKNKFIQESRIFNDCRFLSKIVISSSVTSIDDWAFSNCSSLSKIVIPSSVTSIGRGAFAGCI